MTPDEFAPLGPAEEKLAAGVAAGVLVEVSGGVPDRDAGPELRVRAAFLEFLALGGAAGAAPGPKGLRLCGALIEGEALDFKGATLPAGLELLSCRIPCPLDLGSATAKALVLDGSVLEAGLVADGLSAQGGVSLVGATVTGEIQLRAANLGGDLVLAGATLDAGDGFDALNFESALLRGSVSFDSAKVRGDIRLIGAEIGADLDCDGLNVTASESAEAINGDWCNVKGSLLLRRVRIKGETRFLGARIGGNLSVIDATLAHAGSGDALNLSGISVASVLFMRGATQFDGVLDLSEAQIGTLCDKAEVWPAQGALILNRCRYAAFAGHAPVTAADRIRWLALQTPEAYGQDFWPQPWEQCARVFREMGHADDARAVLIDKERRQRRARRQRASAIARPFLWLGDTLLGLTTRYGRQPLLAVIWLIAVLLLGVGVFGTAAARDAIKPNNVVVLRSAEWVGCDPGYTATAAGPPKRFAAVHVSQLDCYETQPEARSYPRFNAIVYSADTLLPVISLEMQNHWIPDSNHRIGAAARVYLWFHIAVGWALSLLAVAGFSGLIKSD